MTDEHERSLFERGVRAALENRTGHGLDAALHDLGWYEALRTETAMAISTLFELNGELNTSSSLDAVLASVLRPDDPMAAVVLPRFGSADPPAMRDGGTLVVLGIGGARLRASQQVILATPSEIHTARSSDLDLRDISGMNPAAGLVEVTGTVGVGSLLPDDIDVSDDSGSERWQQCVAIGRLAVSHELIGASRGMLGLARDYAIERIQFGRPISSFQAVRHRLADGLVAVAAAEASVAAAWEIGSPFAASVAKAVAGRSARVVARHSQQVLAGVGFTAEHPLHRFVKRTLLLDQIFGASGTITRSIGEELLRAGVLPNAIAL